MRMAKLIMGLRRRLLRVSLRREACRGQRDRSAGVAKLGGYGIQVVYPDRLVWLHQFLEIFDDDCYGVSGLSKSPRVIDGGANVGTFTLYTKWRRPNSSIVAIEPSQENLNYLKRNILQLRQPAVEVVHAALGRTEGSVQLTGRQNDSYRTAPATSGDSIPVVPLSRFLGTTADLLKLDIEGDELAALEGAGSGLANVKRAVIEIHDFSNRQSDLCAIISHLSRYGFDRFSIGSNREFQDHKPDEVSHCSLLHAWRSARNVL